jgi:hypothetical protein
MKREYAIPAWLEENISTALSAISYDLNDSKKIAECVLRLSDFFISSPSGVTPWKEKWAQAAYISYFLPLNYLRNQAVVDLGLEKKFFEGFDRIIDFGAGPGTASLALKNLFSPQQGVLIENAPEAMKLSRHFGPFNFSQEVNRQNLSRTLAVFSYSLTEIGVIPQWAYECEGLMILEPSTQDNGRKLQEWRQELLSQDFYAWAPCTHQLACPQLTHSKKDWCHDRIFFNPPAWFTKIEDKLPIKNKTLTYSYLLVRKNQPEHTTGIGRLVGDQLEEKGKTRQMFCRGEKREFLAWMHRNGDAPELYRGNLFTLPEHEEKSNELRIK